jgi:hypothetical protein
MIIRSTGLLVGSALALTTLASCGSSSDPYRGFPTDATPLNAPADVWTWVDVPGSQCDDGTPTGFAVNPHDTSDLFIFFEGGGACWDYLTCYIADTATHGPVGQTEWAAREAGLVGPFDRTRASNPFRNATMVYIPYCTGDLHAGDNVAHYVVGADDRTYYHKGLPDTVAFLSQVASTWRDPARVVFSGSSAGGYGATLNYDRMRQTYPGARMYLVDDAGPLLEGDAVPPTERAAWFSAWNIGGLVDSFCTGCENDLSNAYPSLNGRYPNDRMALLSSLQDATIRSYFMLTPDQFQTALIAMVEGRLEPAASFHAFLISGEQHTLLGTVDQSTTGGVVLESWLDQMVNDHTGWVTVQP